MSSTPDFDLTGTTALVTGGSRGIGRMITEGLLRRGARVYVCSRKQHELDATAAELAAIGDIRTFTADLGTADGVHALATHLTDQESTLRLLVNNAGANWGAPIDDFPDSAWDKVLNVNLKGVFVLTQALLPLLRAASVPGDPARVVNIGSIDGLRAPERGYNNFSYAASKAGVHLLTQQLSAELAPGITVNAIAPGLFESKMTGALLESARDQVSEQIPMGRIGAPDDVAGLVAYLAGPTSSYVTGAVIPLDGGVSAHR